MKLFIIAGLLAFTSAFSKVDPNLDDMVEYINNLGTTWKAGHNYLRNMPQEDKIRMMTGLLETPEDKKVPVREKIVPNGWVAPESFDAREEWPDCDSIPKIQDQGACGSCWAVAAVTVMSDRACIHSQGTQNFQYSMENLIACSNNLLVGSCSGGYIGAAFEYWINHGIVSGGPYNSGEGCQPYTIAPTGLEAANIIVGERTPDCHNMCIEGYNVLYGDDLRYGQEHAAIPNDEEEIKYEIMTNGPVEVGFTVYYDFELYESGVYQHETGARLGGHAVRIIGWGVEDDIPYWLVANSWNTSWGDNGYFKIIRGVNECGIEGEVNAGIPKLN